MTKAMLPILLLVAALGACAPPPRAALRTYQMPALAIAAPRAELFAAVKRYAWVNAWVNGWKVVRTDVDIGEIEIVTTEQLDEAGDTRQRWTFHITEGRVAVAMQLELRTGGDGDGWKSSGLIVCGDYRYAQEREQLAHLKGVVERSTRNQVAHRPVVAQNQEH